MYDSHLTTFLDACDTLDWIVLVLQPCFRIAPVIFVQCTQLVSHLLLMWLWFVYTNRSIIVLQNLYYDVYTPCNMNSFQMVLSFCFFMVVPCILMLSKSFIYQLMHKRVALKEY